MQVAGWCIEWKSRMVYVQPDATRGFVVIVAGWWISGYVACAECLFIIVLKDSANCWWLGIPQVSPSNNPLQKGPRIHKKNRPVID